jgi:Calx-beta domain
VRVTAGGQSVSYQGNVTSGQPFESLAGFSMESSDVLQPAPFSAPTNGPIAFTLNVGNSGHDGIDFAVAPGAGGCISLTAPGGLPVWAGSDRVPVGETIDLTDFGLCAGSAFSLSAADVNVNEAAGPAVFTVNLSPAPGAGAQVQVSYQTADGSALAASDYTAASGTLTFGPGETQKTVSVPITNDTNPESNETFTVMLTSVDTNSVSATATILDDDSGSLPACGKPTYDKATETGIFIWNDCANTDQWHVRVTAGGQSVSYQGNVTSGQPFESLAGFSMESSDVLQPAPFSTPTDGPIDFTLNVGSVGHDGIDFAVAPGAGGCISLTAPGGLPVWAGSDRVPVGETIGLSDFGACP